MTTAAHAAAGALVGAIIGDPIGGLVAGLVSHAVLDLVPHYDLSDYRVDVVLTLLVSVVLIVLSGGNAALVMGLIGGVLPDLENLLFKLGWIDSRSRIFPTHGGPLPHGRSLGPTHAVWQVMIIALAFWRAAG